MEKKFFDAPLEVKFLSEDAENKTATFEGYGSIFNVEDSYSDIVERGAFADSLNRNMPSMLWQHNQDQPIGVYTEAREDDKGLYLKGEINLEVQAGREAYSLIKQKAIKGLSIGFMTEEDEFDRVLKVRRLKKLNLMEVSLVTFPANKYANVTGWKAEIPQTEREFEKFLRHAGYGRTQSKAITSGGFKAYLGMQRDAEHQEEPITVQRDADMDKLNSELKNLLSTLKELHNERRCQTDG